MLDAVTEALQLIADIDNDYLHAVNDPMHPQHRMAKKCYSELTDWLSIELSKRGARDYQVGRNAPEPPRLRETRPGFCRNKSGLA